jgi:iron uptake system component EfeO
MTLAAPQLRATATRSNPLSGIAVLGIAALAAVALSGCVSNATSGGASAVTVSSTSTQCSASSTAASSGTVVFSVTNDGDQVTEFYVLGSDEQRVVSELENIGPGLSRDLIVSLSPGDYFTACKPGMAGERVGVAAFTVTD